MKKAVRFAYVICDGKSEPAAEVCLSPFSRLATYGEGCFDTLRCSRGGIVLPGSHLKRLHRGMQYLGLEIPAGLSDLNAFLNQLKHLLDINDGFDDMVRIRTQVWADDHTSGYRPGGRSARFLITGSLMDHPSLKTDPFNEMHREIRRSEMAGPSGNSGNTDFTDISSPPVSLVTSRYRRIAEDSLPSDVKWTNGINYILAAREAAEKKAGDALMLTHDGFVSETTIANIFWKSGDTVYTPSDDCDLLPGITRALTLEVLQDSGIPVRTGRYTVDELKMADTVWLCNAVREWYPVSRIDGHSFGPDQVFRTSVHDKWQQRMKDEMYYVR